MMIEQLIKDLKKYQEEYNEAQCFVGVNPKALYIVMGYKTIMLKLDGNWEYSNLEKEVIE